MLLATKKKPFWIFGKIGVIRFPYITKYVIGNTGINFGTIASIRKKKYIWLYEISIIMLMRDIMNAAIFQAIRVNLFRGE